MMLHIFHMLISQYPIFLSELAVQIFCCFFSFFVCLFFIIELYDLFVYSGSKSFIRYIVVKYILPLYDLSFHSLNVFIRTKFLISMQSNLSAFFFFKWFVHLLSCPRTLFLTHSNKDFLVHFLLRVF